LEGARHVRVGCLAEADVAVADLSEGKIRLLRPTGVLAQRAGGEDATGHRPGEAGAGPGHAAEKAAAVDAVVAGVVGDAIFHRVSLVRRGYLTITRAVIFGWTAQKYS